MIAIPIIVFVAVSFAAFTFGVLLDQRSARARLIRARVAAAPAGAAPQETLALLRDEMLSRIPVLDTILRRSQRASKLQMLLEQAGLTVRVGNMLLFSLVSAAILGVMGYLLTGTLERNEAVLLTFAFAGLGAIVPYSYASWRRNRRFINFEETFPEAMDTLARAVRAGHAFTMAIEIVCNELAEPVATEFRKLYEEQKYGMPVRDALLNLTERMPLVDVKFFVTAVMLQRETGGNLAEILDNLSYMIRERFKILRQVKVYTAQGRLTMMLLMGLPPTIVITMLVVNPGFIRPLFDDPIGHMLLAAGITLQTIGYFVIRRIIRIQV
ncbi:MAG TPA: type II secretion system F family protein [Terriglobales bacterium]